MLQSKRAKALNKHAFRQASSEPPPKICVIGGVAGGASAATRLRRNCEKCSVVMFERGKFVSFANCGLPYYVGGVISDEKKLLAATPDLFKERFAIDVRTQSDVQSIDRQRKVLRVNSAERGEYEEPYDYCIIATGAKPIRPPLEGLNSPGVFSLRSIENSRAIREYIDSLADVTPPRKCVIVGGGFIGLEMVENLVKRGLECTIVDSLPQVMGIVDRDMIGPIHRVLRENGVHLVLDEMIDRIVPQGSSCLLNLYTKNGIALDAHLVIMAVGVSPESDLASDAGLELGVRGSIQVDEAMRTSDPSIFAVGDVVETYNTISQTKTNLALAGPAQQQARIVADVITKINSDAQFRGVQGSSVCGVFGEVVAQTGLSMNYIERFVPELLPKVEEIYVHPGHHVDFYPNAQKIHLKVVFDKSNGKVLGACCVGKEAVVKQIDTLAAFIQMGATVEDIAHAELCYAPAFGAARGPINIIGQLGMNVRNGLVELSDWKTLHDGEKVILDVRSLEEVNDQPVQTPNQVLTIPIDELRNRLSELEEYRSTPLHVMCETGKRAYVACRFLSHMGFKPRLCSGGMTTLRMICRGDEPNTVYM